MRGRPQSLAAGRRGIVCKALFYLARQPPPSWPRAAQGLSEVAGISDCRFSIAD